jgi:hypothetical protein
MLVAIFFLLSPAIAACNQGIEYCRDYQYKGTISTAWADGSDIGLPAIGSHCRLSGRAMTHQIGHSH